MGSQPVCLLSHTGHIAGVTSRDVREIGEDVVVGAMDTSVKVTRSDLREGRVTGQQEVPRFPSRLLAEGSQDSQ